MLKLTLPDGITAEDIGSETYSNRWGSTSLTRLEKAVAWLGEVVPGIVAANLTCIKNESPDGSVLKQATVEFTVGNLTSQRYDAITLTNMASTTRIELLNEFYEGAGANVYVPAPIFKD